MADATFAGLGICAGFYLAVRYPSLSLEYYLNQTEAALIGPVVLARVLAQGGISAVDIILVGAAVAFGIWAIGAGMTGYFLTALKPYERGLALAAGGLLLVSRFDLPLENVFLGVGAAGTAAIYLLTRRRA